MNPEGECFNENTGIECKLDTVKLNNNFNYLTIWPHGNGLTLLFEVFFFFGCGNLRSKFMSDRICKTDELLTAAVFEKHLMPSQRSVVAHLLQACREFQTLRSVSFKRLQKHKLKKIIKNHLKFTPLYCVVQNSPIYIPFA